VKTANITEAESGKIHIELVDTVERKTSNRCDRGFTAVDVELAEELEAWWDSALVGDDFERRCRDVVGFHNKAT
jgi:hypothetical protein